MGRDGDEQEQRWGAAQRVLDGEDPGDRAQQQLRRQRVRLRVLCGVLLLLPLLVIAVVLALHSGTPTRSAPRLPVPLEREVLGLVLSGAGLLVATLGLVRLFRRRVRRKALNAPLEVLAWAQRRELIRQVRGQAPVDPGRLALSRTSAELLLGQRETLLLLGGQVLTQTGLALVSAHSFQVALAAVSTAVCIVAMPLTVREVRRARAFLTQHPAST